MREGEYFRAFTEARNSFRKDSKNLIDVWIIVECSRKRNASLELVSLADELVSKQNTLAARLLQIRGLNLRWKWLVYHQEKGKSEKEFAAIQKRILALERELRAEASNSIVALCTLLSSTFGDVQGNRQSASAFASSHPDLKEAAFLRVRSLLRGDFGPPLPSIIDGKEVMPKNPGNRLVMYHPNEPRMDQALKVLDEAESKFGKSAVFSYYRGVAYCMKAYFSDPKKDDERSLNRLADYHLTKFMEFASDYPRLASCVRDYRARKHLSAFYPPTDE